MKRPRIRKRLLTVKNTQKRERRQKAVNQAVMRATMPSVDAINSAYDALRSGVPGASKETKTASLIAALLEQRTAQKLILTSREKYLEFLQLAFAAYIALIAEGTLEHSLIELSKKTQTKITRNTDPITIILRALIDYGQVKGRPDPAKRSAWSRDAGAIHWLEHEQVKPGEILSYQVEQGGGIDTWSRSWTQLRRGESTGKSQRHSPAEFFPEPKEDHPPPPQSLEEMLSETMADDGEGAVLLVVRENHRLVCKSSMVVGPVDTKMKQAALLTKIRFAIGKLQKVKPK